MHLLFVIPGMGFGGAERVVANLACEMIKNNDVSIIVTSSEAKTSYFLDSRIRFETVYNALGAVKIWGAFRKRCIELRPDIVIGFLADTGTCAAISLIGTGIPVIISERNDPSRNAVKSLRSKMLRFLGTHLAKGFVFQSEGAKSLYPKRAQRKSCVILNPLNLDSLPKRDKNCIQNRVVTVGRLHIQKNHELLIEAFVESRLCISHTLHIYGEGELRSKLEKLIKDKNAEDKVILEGNTKDVHEKIKNARLFAFTSDYEGLPNALMEAMAIGLPCVSTDCSPGGARMLIKNKGNGILVNCGDKEALTEVFDQVYANSINLDNLGREAESIRNIVRIDTIANSWMEFINLVKKGE